MVKEEHTKIISKRLPNTHKYHYGHVLVIAGSTGMTGAAYLCSQAAMLSGSGVVTLAVPSGINDIMEVKLTEVITSPQPQTKEGTLSYKACNALLSEADKANAVVMGCGLGRHAEIKKLVTELIKTIKVPMVVDADALFALSDEMSVLKEAQAPVIITPHAGEAARLLNITANEVEADRQDIAKELAKKYSISVVLKGHKTVVSDKDGDIYVNDTGNPGMATAGVGDVLAGMIGSLLGQGLEAFASAKLAVYLHGLSGDIAARKKGQVSLIASDVLDNIYEAIEKI